MTRLLLGDCLALMREMPDDSVDAVVTDPPAGIAFMGKAWDKDKGGSDPEPAPGHQPDLWSST